MNGNAKGRSIGVALQGRSTGQVIVIDDSDTEAEVIKKRPRVSTASRRESAKGISSDEQVVSSRKKVKQKVPIGSLNARFDSAHDSEQHVEAEQAMWCDTYAPTSTADLAPSKTRVQSVRSWLEEALHGRPSAVDQDIPVSQLAKDRIRKYRRILVLSGPAGAGKTTTLKVVAEEMNVQVVEWEEGAEEWNMAGQIGKHLPPYKFPSARHADHEFPTPGPVF